MHVTFSPGQTKTTAATKAERTPVRKKRASRKKKPVGHVANLEMIDRFNAARREGLPFTYKEYARLEYIQWRIAQGITTEFPGQLQVDAVQNLSNFSWSNQSAVGTPLKK